MASFEAEPVVQSRALLGESPIWDPRSQLVLWLDFRKQEIHRFSPSSGVDEVIFAEPTAISAMALRRKGDLVVAAGRGFGFFSFDLAATEWIAAVEDGDRMNDGACDPVGRFLAGTASYERRPAAGLYCLEPNLTVRRVLSGITLSNGIDWTSDGETMFFVDTPTREISSFRYDLETGDLSERRVFADLTDTGGNPDGLTVDREGHVWVALFRAGEVHRYAPNSDLVQVVQIPAKFTTSCCFGGPDLSDLYVTSASRAMTSAQLVEEELAGSLFRIHTDTQGQEARFFEG